MKYDLKEKDEGRSEKKPAEALYVKVARAESNNDDEHIHLFMAQMLQKWKAEVAERWIVDLGASSSITVKIIDDGLDFYFHFLFYFILFLFFFYFFYF